MGKNDMDSGNENENEKIEINPTTGKPIERRKIEIKFIQNKTKRHVTFSKRKHGIMKKAYELSVLTGTQVLLLVVSETGLVYTFTTPKFQPIVTQPEGKNLIQACLNAPDEEDEEDDEEEDDDDENENENENDENENEAMEEEEEEIDGEIGDEDGEVENNNGEEGEPESGEMGQDVHGVNMGVTNAIRKRNMIHQDPNAMVDTSLHNEGDNDNDNDINNNNGVENGNHNLGKTSKRRKTTDHSMSKNNDGTGQLNHSIPQHYQQQQQQQQQQQYLAQQQQHPNIGLPYSTYNARGTAQ